MAFTLVSYIATIFGFLFFYYVLGSLVVATWRRKLPSFRMKRIPLNVVLGIGFWSIAGTLFAAAGIFREASQTSFLVVVAIGVLLLARAAYEKRREDRVFRSLFSAENLATLAVLSLSVVLFASMASLMFWGPPGDAVTHATSVAILQENGVLPTPPNSNDAVGIPLAVSPSSALGYPPGFAVNAALIGINGGLYPGRSVVIAAALVSSLIPLVAFALALRLTRSVYWSLPVAILALLLPDGLFSFWPHHDLVVANLINGTYPNHMGNLLVLGLLLILLQRSMRSWEFWMTYASLGLVYPPYVAYGILFLTAYLITSAVWRRKVLHKRIILRLRPLSPLIVGAFVLIAVGILLSQEIALFINLSFERRFGYNIYEAPRIPDILSWPLIIIPLLAIVVSFLHVLRKEENRVFMLSYFLFGILMLTNMSPGLYDSFLFLTFPNRIVSVFRVLSFALLLTLLSTVDVSSVRSWIGAFGARLRQWSKSSTKSSREPGTVSHRANYGLDGPDLGRTRASVAQSIAGDMSTASSAETPRFGVQGPSWPRAKSLLMPVLLVVLTYLVMSPYAAFRPPLQTIGGDELAVLEFGLPLVSDDSVILNDRSFSGLFLPSVMLKKIVNIRAFPGGPILDRALDTYRVLTNPEDYDLSRDVLHRWNISYVFISGNSYVVDLLPDGSFSGFVWRGWKPDVYLDFFLENPNLELVVRQGDAGLFRVI